MDLHRSPVRSHPARADVVVVGARCAGAATALLLARHGHDVVLVDRSSFPSDTTSTHAFVRGGVVQLSRFGLLDELLATGVPPIRSVSFWHRGSVDRRPVKDKAGVDLLIAPRRHVLDQVLISAAVDAGARLVTGATVTGARRDHRGRVTGVLVRDTAGSTHDIASRLVVGADGVGSRVARHVGAATVEQYTPSGACFYAYVGDVPWDGYEFHLGDDQAFGGVFPTHDGEACVWLIRPLERMRDVIGAGANRQDAWMKALRLTVPELADAVSRGTVTSPVRGAVGLPNRRRTAAGAGWALVGDAGYHRDPITGHGMTDALRDAELLAEAAHRGLSGIEDEAAAWQAYQAERDTATDEIFALTRAIGAFPDPETFQELQGRLARALDQEAQALASRPVPAGTATAAA
jgi:2-polyprenyl-6-methoxyphenol hydroxylase-like FAD-dependent oxidoreductase